MTTTKEWTDALAAYEQAARPERQGLYLNRLLPLFLPRLRERYDAEVGRRLPGPIDHLVSVIGFSPEPIIVMIKVLQAREVTFLYTQETRSQLDVITKHTGLAPSRCNMVLIASSSMVDIYRAVKQVCDRSRGRAAVDITGGKKVMAAGAALAGSYLGLDILYMDYDAYLPDNRTPQPGSEFIALIDDPVAVAGDREYGEAQAKWERHDYAGAMAVLYELSKRVMEPQRCLINAEIAKGYAHWEDFNFGGAVRAFEKALDEMARFLYRGPVRDTIEGQRELLQCLSALPNTAPLEVLQDRERAWLLILSCYLSAQRRQQQQRYDMAALLVYRSLELVVQRRLALWGVDTKDPDYAALTIGRETLRQRFVGAGARAVGKRSFRLSNLPRPLGLTNGLILLAALEDPGVDPRFVPDVVTSVDQRNQSILAHGTKLVSDKAFRKFYGCASAVLERAWKAEGEAPFGRSLLEMAGKLEFGGMAH